MFQGKKEGSKKYIGEWFQEYVCKTNIKSTTSSAKIAKQSAQKLESWCTTLKAWKVLTFESKFVLRIGFIVKVTAGCSVLVWYIIINITRSFGTKNNGQPFSRFAYKQCKHWNTKKLCFLCALMLSRKKLSFLTSSVLKSVFQGA